MPHWLEELDEVVREADANLDSGGWMREDHDALLAMAPTAAARLAELDGLLGGDDPEVRVMAATLLGALVQAVTRPPWFLAALYDAARAAVARLQAEVIDRAAGDPDARVRVAATEVLIELAGERYRNTVARSLGGEGAGSTVAGSPGGEALGAAIAGRLADEDPRVQDVALAWLARRGDPRVAAVVRARLASDDCDWATFVHARMIGLPDAGPLLARWLDDPDESVRSHACEAAIEHAREAATKHASDAGSQHAREAASQHAREAAVERGDEALVPALCAALRHDDRGAVHAAIALARCPRAAVPQLLARLRTTPRADTEYIAEVIGDAAVLALASVEDPEVERELAPLVGPPRSRLRLVALGLVRDERVSGFVRGELRSQDGYRGRLAALVCDDRHRLRELLNAKEIRRDDRARRDVALGLAGVSIDAVDQRVAEVLAEPWEIKTDDVWSEHGVAIAIALGRIAGQLERRREPLGPAPRRGLAGIAALLDTLDAAMAPALLCYRGRGTFSSLTCGLLFYVRDRAERARAALL